MTDDEADVMRARLPELVGVALAVGRESDRSDAAHRRFMAAHLAVAEVMDALWEHYQARRRARAVQRAGDELAAPVMSPTWRARRLAEWPPGVPGVRREARSARVATLLDPVGVAFLAPPEGVDQPHPDGVRVVMSLTWQEAVQVAATHGL